MTPTPAENAPDQPHPRLAGTPLPSHNRARQGFAQTFPRTAEQTIAAMDTGGHDIPNQTPRFPLAVQRVGVSRRWIPVRLHNPLGGTSPVELACDVDVSVDLAADRRGIHVSRIGDLLARLADEVYPSLSHYAGRVHDRLRAAQESATATVAVSGVLTYREDVRGVKEKQSLEHLELSAGVKTRAGRVELSQGVGFSHITACPCVQETYRNALSPETAPLHRARAEAEMPLLTHSQRCRTQVIVTGANGHLPLRPLLAVIDRLTVRSQNTLPREFELLNVHRAHRQPQFLEDVVRELTHGVHQLLAGEHPAATIRIRSTSMESIHDFDMSGEIEFTVAELNTLLADA